MHARSTNMWHINITKTLKLQSTIAPNSTCKENRTNQAINLSGYLARPGRVQMTRKAQQVIFLEFNLLESAAQ